MRCLRPFGFGMAIRSSRALDGCICYSGVTFRAWLLARGAETPVERELKRFFLSALTKVPRFEDEYADVLEDTEFDLVWGDRVLFVNERHTIPAFLLSVLFKLPTVALHNDIFAECAKFDLIRRTLNDDGSMAECHEEVVSLSSASDVGNFEGILTEHVTLSIRTGADVLRVQKDIFSNLSFSDDVKDALPKFNILSFPLVHSLLRLQKIFEKCISEERCDFFEAYGHFRTIASDESESTHNRYPLSRTFHWDGVPRECWPHLKHGRFRIHFSPDFPDGKLYVGYIGVHLPLGG